MATVNWIYGDMWRWFTEVGEDVAYPVADVIVTIFEANYEVIKYRTAPSGQEYGPLEPFVKRNSQVHKVHATDPMVSAHSHSGTDGMVQHGLYIVTDAPSASFDTMEKIRRKKNLYVVFPRRFESIVVADHVSFCIDRGDKDKRPVRLHVTRYTPNDLVPGHGMVGHVRNNLASSIDAVPRDLEAFSDLLLRTPLILPYASLLRDVLMRPYADPPADADADTDIASTAGGSGGKQKRRHQRRRRAAAAADPHRERRTPFEQAWFDLPLRKMVVIGVPSAPSSVHFTAYVYDRMSHPLRGGSLGLHFVLGAAAARDEAQVTSAIAGLLAGRRWDDFIDIPEDEVY